jgi:MOSC domain-containing protein YiiM
MLPMTIAPDAVTVALWVCPGRTLPMLRLERAELVAGRGVIGDRRFALSTKPQNQLTLIEEEALLAARVLCRDAPGPDQQPSARRNVVTRGVALNHLVGRTFRVGGAVVRGIELCEPCGHLARMSSRTFEKALLHRGGLRAEILASGVVVDGDPIRPA